MNRRLGKITLRDCWQYSCIIIILTICIVLLISVGGYSGFIWLGFVGLIYPVIKMVLIFEDKFKIEHGTISRECLFYRDEIALPSEKVLIVTELDVCAKSATRTFWTEKDLQKAKIGCVILTNISAEEALNKLRSSPFSFPYPASTIRSCFPAYQVVFSFAVEEQSMQIFEAIGKWDLVIPRSLARRFPVNLCEGQILVDDRY